ncbi:hypothetical protein [Corynebacterium sp.]|uniref:hypothetical protein n=1 Tax=Corynebacterium sp. TaxID=1720 RepID=UPI0028A9F1BA|nr:hypothetical protein [Corynebacterium sp.]
MTPPIPTSAQKLCLQLLEAATEVRVSTEIPDPRPARHIVLTRIGGAPGSIATNDPRFLIEVYAEDALAAEQLAEIALHAVRWPTYPGVVAGDADSLAHYPSPDVDHVRFQFTCSLRIRL